MSDLRLITILPPQQTQPVSQAGQTAQGTNSQSSPTATSLPPGSVLTGFIVNRDAQGNPVLRTENGDVTFSSNFFLKIGSEVVVRIENFAGNSQAHLLSVNGQPPEVAEGQSGFSKTPDVIVGSPPSSSQNASSATTSTLLQATAPAQDSIVSSPATGAITATLISATHADGEPPVLGVGSQLGVKIVAITAPSEDTAPVATATITSQPVTPSATTQNNPALYAAYTRGTATPAPAAQAPAENATPLPAALPVGNNSVPANAPNVANVTTQTINAQGQTLPATPAEVATTPAPVATSTAETVITAPATPSEVTTTPTPIATPAAETAIAAPAPVATPTAETAITAPAITTAAPTTIITTTAPNPPSVATATTPQPTVNIPAATTAIIAAPATPAASAPASLPAPVAATQTALPPTALPVSGQNLTATVLPNQPGGDTLVQTSYGILKLPAGTTLPQGSTVTLEVSNVSVADAIQQAAADEAQPPAPLTTLAQQWPSLQQIVTLLSQRPAPSDPTTPSAASLAGATLPTLLAAAAPTAPAEIPPQAITTGLMLFVAALRGGDLSNWLGKSNTQWLEDEGHGDLVRRASSEFSSIAQQYNAPVQSQQWQSLFFPLAVAGHWQQVRLFVKRDRKQQGGNQANAKSEDTRFVVEVNLSQMGQMQMDGMVRKREKTVDFDLYIRSLTPIDSDMQKEIFAIYNQVGQLTGYKGNLAFQAVKEFPVNPMEEVMAQGTGSVVA